MKQPFPQPTEEQKKELAMLHMKLMKKPYKFNLYTLIARIKKIKGYYPPIDLILEVSKNALQSRPANMWAYYMASIRNELPEYFADLNIKEHEKYKNAPTGMKDIMKRLGGI